MIGIRSERVECNSEGRKIHQKDEELKNMAEIREKISINQRSNGKGKIRI